jgi:hypothetical protein
MSLDPDLTAALGKMMRGDLDAWSNIWFWTLVCSTIAVAIGIICEAPEIWLSVGFGGEITSRIRGFWYVRIRKTDLNGWERLCPELMARNDRHVKWVAKWGLIGWTLVAIGVAGEGVAEYFVNDAETNIRSFDEVLLSETQQSANSAASASSVAYFFAEKSESVSSSAMTTSRAARREADSFEQDIAATKQQASEAKSQIVDAFKQASAATVELNRLKTPRVLLTPSGLSSALKEFKGTEYTFSSVFQDDEAIELLKQIDSALQLAEWKRVPFQAPAASIIITLDSGVKVPPGVKVGVLVSAEASEHLESLSSMPIEKLPQWIKAAVELRFLLGVSISPSQGDTGKNLAVSAGTSHAIRIDVGRKP